MQALSFAAAAVSAHEKRVARRIPVGVTAQCRIGNRHVRDEIADLSATGLYLRTREPAREGTEVRVGLALPSLTGQKFCTLVGKVARIDWDRRGILRGLGLRIADGTDPRDLLTLDAFLQEA
jgi:PilZ domain